MGSERVGELPEDLEAWVAERAAAEETTREDVVRRLITAHRLLEEHPERLEDAAGSATAASADDSFAEPTDSAVDVADAANVADATDVDDLESEVADLESELDGLVTQIDDLVTELDDLTTRVGSLETDLDEKIDDVRQRVIQVKRESDAKAPADHDHPDIERRLTQGFENYEEILEYLTEQTDDLTTRTDSLARRTERLADRTDDHTSKLSAVASTVVDLRTRVSEVERAVEARDAAADLRREANRHGITTAACESCGESVTLGLLDEPACPHCESPFDGVDPKTGFFGSNRLTVGRRPALESAPAERPGETGTAPTDHASDAPADSTATATEPGDARSETHSHDPEGEQFAGEPVDSSGSDAGDSPGEDAEREGSEQSFEGDIADFDSDSVNDGGSPGDEPTEPLSGGSGDDSSIEADTRREQTESDGGTDTGDRNDSDEPDSEFRFGSEVQGK